MLFRRTGSSADTITTCATTEQENNISGSGALAAYVLCLNSTNNRTYLQTLCGISVVENLANVSGRKTYLVTIVYIIVISV